MMKWMVRYHNPGARKGQTVANDSGALADGRRSQWDGRRFSLRGLAVLGVAGLRRLPIFCHRPTLSRVA